MPSDKIANLSARIAKLLAESTDHPMIDVDGVMKHRHNSEGRPIHHTDDGIRNFHRWFGDSKVTDKHGRPEVLYHGTKADFTSFGDGGETHGSEAGYGHYLSTSPSRASTYATSRGGEGGRVIPVYVKSSKPFVSSHASGGDVPDLEHHDTHAIASYVKSQIPVGEIPEELHKPVSTSFTDQMAARRHFSAQRDAWKARQGRPVTEPSVDFVDTPKSYVVHHHDPSQVGVSASPWRAWRSLYGAFGPSATHVLQHAGFDSHRTGSDLVAFHAHQIKSALGNKGTFSPHTDHIGEGVNESADGKKFTKVVKDPDTGRTRHVRYGAAGSTISPGSARGDAYCKRSNAIEGDWRDDPNSPNNLSRRKWKCHGDKSMRECIRIDLNDTQPLVITEAKMRGDIKDTITRLSNKKGWRKVGMTRESILGHVDRKFIHHAEHYAKMLNGGTREDGSTFKGAAGVGKVFLDLDENSATVVINGSKEWNAAPHTYETTIRFNNYDKIANLPEHTWAEKARALMEDHMQVHCTCEAFQFYHAHAATVKGFALVEEKRPARKNNPLKRGGVCKHMEHALRYVPANYAKIAAGMKQGASLSEEVLVEANIARPLSHQIDANGNSTYDWHEPDAIGNTQHYRAWFDKTNTHGRYDTGFGTVDHSGNLDTQATLNKVDVSNVGATFLKAMRHHITSVVPSHVGTIRHVHYQYQPVADTAGNNAGKPHEGKRASVYRRWWDSSRFGGNEKVGADPRMAGAKVIHKPETYKDALVSVHFPNGLRKHVDRVGVEPLE